MLGTVKNSEQIISRYYLRVSFNKRHTLPGLGIDGKMGKQYEHKNRNDCANDTWSWYISKIPFLFSEQPTASEPEATTRRPTRPRNFDPRRQRVSINAANSLPTGEPTILPNIKLVKEWVVKKQNNLFKFANMSHRFCCYVVILRNGDRMSNFVRYGSYMEYLQKRWSTLQHSFFH